MGEKFWTVLEIQRDNRGIIGAIAQANDREAEAQSSYFSICAAAALSAVPYHAALLINDSGDIEMMRIFDRRKKEAEV